MFMLLIKPCPFTFYILYYGINAAYRWRCAFVFVFTLSLLFSNLFHGLLCSLMLYKSMNKPSHEMRKSLPLDLLFLLHSIPLANPTVLALVSEREVIHQHFFKVTKSKK